MEMKSIISNSLKNLMIKTCRVDQLNSDNLSDYYDLVDQIYPYDQFEEMNESSKFTVQYNSGLSTLLFINDEYVGFCIVERVEMSDIEDVTDEMTGVLDPGLEETLRAAVQNGEVAYVTDFGIKNEVSGSGFLLMKYLKEIINKFKNSGIRYVVSNFRKSTSMKLLDLLVSSDNAKKLGELIYKQDPNDEDVTELDNEPFPFGVIKLNNSLKNLALKIGQTQQTFFPIEEKKEDVEDEEYITSGQYLNDLIKDLIVTYKENNILEKEMTEIYNEIDTDPLKLKVKDSLIDSFRMKYNYLFSDENKNDLLENILSVINGSLFRDHSLDHNYVSLPIFYANDVVGIEELYSKINDIIKQYYVEFNIDSPESVKNHSRNKSILDNNIRQALRDSDAFFDNVAQKMVDRIVKASYTKAIDKWDWGATDVYGENVLFDDAQLRDEKNRILNIEANINKTGLNNYDYAINNIEKLFNAHEALSFIDNMYFVLNKNGFKQLNDRITEIPEIIKKHEFYAFSPAIRGITADQYQQLSNGMCWRMPNVVLSSIEKQTLKTGLVDFKLLTNLFLSVHDKEYDNLIKKCHGIYDNWYISKNEKATYEGEVNSKYDFISTIAYFKKMSDSNDLDLNSILNDELKYYKVLNSYVKKDLKWKGYFSDTVSLENLSDHMSDQVFNLSNHKDPEKGWENFKSGYWIDANQPRSYSMETLSQNGEGDSERILKYKKYNWQTALEYDYSFLNFKEPIKTDKNTVKFFIDFFSQSNSNDFSRFITVNSNTEDELSIKYNNIMQSLKFVQNYGVQFGASEQEMNQIRSIKGKDILSDMLRMHTIINLPQDGTLIKRIMAIGQNYIAGLNPQHRTHVGWNDFLFKYKDKFLAAKALLADPDVYDIGLDVLGEIIERRDECKKALGPNFRDKFKVIDNYILEVGFGAKYNQSDLNITSSHWGKESVDLLKDIYSANRYKAPEINEYDDFLRELNSKRRLNYGENYHVGIMDQNIPTGSIEIDGYIFEVTAKNDKINIMLGNITKCCQVIGGAAENCVLDGMSNPSAGFLIVYPKEKNGDSDRKIVAQSYIWESDIPTSNNYDKYLILDNIETRGYFNISSMEQRYLKWAEYIKERGNYIGVYCGMSYGKITFNDLDLMDQTEVDIIHNYKDEETYSDSDEEMKRIAKIYQRNSLICLSNNIKDVVNKTSNFIKCGQTEIVDNKEQNSVSVRDEIISYVFSEQYKAKVYEKFLSKLNMKDVRKYFSNLILNVLDRICRRMLNEEINLEDPISIANEINNDFNYLVPIDFGIGLNMETLSKEVAPAMIEYVLTNPLPMAFQRYINEKTSNDDIVFELAEEFSREVPKKSLEILLSGNITESKNLIQIIYGGWNVPNSLHLLNYFNALYDKDSFSDDVSLTVVDILNMTVYEILKYMEETVLLNQFENYIYDFSIKMNTRDNNDYYREVLINKITNDMAWGNDIDWNYFLKINRQGGMEYQSKRNFCTLYKDRFFKDDDSVSQEDIDWVLGAFSRFSSRESDYENVDFNKLNEGPEAFKSLSETVSLFFNKESRKYAEYKDYLMAKGIDIFELGKDYKDNIIKMLSGDLDSFKSYYFVEVESNEKPIINIIYNALINFNYNDINPSILKYIKSSELPLQKGILPMQYKYDDSQNRIGIEQYFENSWQKINTYNSEYVDLDEKNRPNILKIDDIYEKIFSDKRYYARDAEYSCTYFNEHDMGFIIRFLSASNPKDIARYILLNSSNESSVSNKINNLIINKNIAENKLNKLKEKSLTEKVLLSELITIYTGENIQSELTTEELDAMLLNLKGIKQKDILNEILRIHSVVTFDDKTLNKRVMWIGRNYISRMSPDNLRHVGWNKFLYENSRELIESKQLLADPEAFQVPLDKMASILQNRKNAMKEYGPGYIDKIAFLKEYIGDIDFDKKYPPNDINEEIKIGNLKEDEVKILKNLYFVDQDNAPELDKFINFVQQVRSRHTAKQNIPPKAVNINGYTFEVTKKNDPINVILGNITNCCQSINGWAEDCVIDGLTNPMAGFLIVYPEGKRQDILCQSYIWESYSNDKKYLVLDNIEIKGVYPKFDVEEMKLNYQQWASMMKADNGYVSVTMGLAYNKLDFQLDNVVPDEIKTIMNGKNVDTYTDADKEMKRIASVSNSIINLSKKLIKKSLDENIPSDSNEDDLKDSKNEEEQARLKFLSDKDILTKKIQSNEVKEMVLKKFFYENQHEEFKRFIGQTLFNELNHVHKKYAGRSVDDTDISAEGFLGWLSFSFMNYENNPAFYLIIEDRFIEELKNKINDEIIKLEEEYPDYNLHKEDICDYLIIASRKVFDNNKELTDNIILSAYDNAINSAYNELMTNINSDVSNLLFKKLKSIGFINAFVFFKFYNICNGYSIDSPDKQTINWIMCDIYDILNYIGLSNEIEYMENSIYDYVSKSNNYDNLYDMHQPIIAILEKQMEKEKVIDWNMFFNVIKCFSSINYKHMDNSSSSLNIARNLFKKFNIEDSEYHKIFKKIVTDYINKYFTIDSDNIDFNFLNDNNVEKIIDFCESYEYIRKGIGFSDYLLFKCPFYELKKKYDDQINNLLSGNFEEFKPCYFIDRYKSKISDFVSSDNVNINDISHNFLKYVGHGSTVLNGVFDERKKKWFEANSYKNNDVVLLKNDRPNVVNNQFNELKFNEKFYSYDARLIYNINEKSGFIRFLCSSNPEDIARFILFNNDTEDMVSEHLYKLFELKKNIEIDLNNLYKQSLETDNNSVLLDKGIYLNSNQILEILSNIKSLKNQDILREIVKMYSLFRTNDKTLDERINAIGRNYLFNLNPSNYNHVGWNSFLFKHEDKFNDLKTLFADPETFQLPLNEISSIIDNREDAKKIFGDKFVDKISFLKAYVMNLGFEEKYKDIQQISAEENITKDEVDILRNIYFIDKDDSPHIDDFVRVIKETRDRNNVNQTILTGAVNINGYTFEVTKKSDPVNFLLGYITNCCQTIEGAGKSCLIDGLTNPNAGFLIVHPEGKRKNILCQSYIWESYSNDKKYLVLDNIEIKGVYPKFDVEQMKLNYQQWSNYMKTNGQYEGVMMGQGFNFEGLNYIKNELKEEILKGKNRITYTDAKSMNQLANVSNSIINLANKIKNLVSKCSSSSVDDRTFLVTRNELETLKMLSHSYSGWETFWKNMRFTEPDEDDLGYDDYRFYHHPIVVSISGDAIEQALNEFKEDGIGVDFNKIPHISNKPLVYTEGFDTGYGANRNVSQGLLIGSGGFSALHMN